MNPITLNDFPTYFCELHGREPYNWQCRLAKQVTEGSWPGAIDLPTGSGKTSCLDIAVFALACQASRPKEKRTAPRRIFFCVNRRVIVDEAHQRAVKIAAKIADAEGSNSILGRVAASLRTLSTLKRDSAPPLDVLELRGGIYRDNRWARSATQPTIVCTTIDQLGSRLLFRGYGVSTNAAPIQAALIAYDSLVLLDEAHISRPFLQTLDFVKRYLDPEKWAEKPVGMKPMIVVPMTATPPEGVSDADVIRLEAKDRMNEGLNNRLKASKKAKLVVVNVPKGKKSQETNNEDTDSNIDNDKQRAAIIETAVSEAISLAGSGPTAVGIIVNRVATAKAIYEKLREAHKDKPDVVIELVIGSMRPIDRDRQAERLRELVGPDRPPATTRPSFIVATQCLEVGADYDFDALVTECASLDALRQRFGRLNRGGRKIEARAVILAGEKDIKEESKLDDAKPLDPIYGNALPRTWNWLCERSQFVREEIDFGIDAFTAILQERGENGRIPSNLLAPSASKNAPVMLPAYVDFWCQTSPQPTPDPEVSLFIHGPEAGEPDVQVCWRADLVEDERLRRENWCDVVALLPPTSAECMSVPISRVRKWLTQDEQEATSDVLGIATTDDQKEEKKPRKKLDPIRFGVLWRGAKDSLLLQSPNDLRPGDTLVLPAQAMGWDDLGHIPEATPETVDVAEIAFQAARDRAALRLHPSLRSRLPDSKAITEFFERWNDPQEELTTAELRNLLKPIAESQLGTTRYLLDYYPDNRGVVLTSRERLGQSHWWILPEIAEADDDRSRTLREQPISLKDHTEHVRNETLRTVRALPLEELEQAYGQAADWHDLGKADERFQAMLRRADRTDAWLLIGRDAALLAKSDGLPQTREQRQQARERAGLPEGFRHEMLSVQIVEHSDLKNKATQHLDLILHLIASHHGYARPLAPVVIDAENPEVMVNGVTLTSEQRQACPPHRIDSGIAERFWELTRCYGWWGLAYLEAVLRLADQQASADEDAGRFDTTLPSAQLAEATS